jgi:hypothetical protein
MPEPKCADQYVIVYGPDFEMPTVYDTAPGRDEIAPAVKRCRKRHGPDCNARSMLAADLDPKNVRQHGV